MIKSFRDKDTEGLWNSHASRHFPVGIQRAALRKLVLVHVAADLNDLRVPPGNHLEALKGDRAGQYSVRINKQWRICFVWQEGDAYDVEIVDYH